VTGLHISPDLELPIDAATETFGIIAKKGAGKSNSAVVMAEEMHAAGVPWVAIDPKGDWWGLRASSDGTGPGLPIVVFGGRHGDVPLEPTAGALIADLVLERGLTCVLDVSEFIPADVRRFLRAFAERLYRQATDEPLHLFLEEAHEYLPQVVRGEDAHLVHAWQRIVKQGRFKGLGCTLITQRSAALNKDVLTQVDTLIVLRTTSPQDRQAVKAWVDVHAESHDMLATLPSLESGEAWVWSPEFLGDLVRIRFRRRSTFDSGATPKVGQKRKEPATLADVDLAAIKDQMAETIEKARADDPKELRKRIRQLEDSLRDWLRHECPAPEQVVERVEVPIVPATTLEAFGEHAGELLHVLAEIEGRLNEVHQSSQQEASTGQPTTRRSAPRATSTSENFRRARDAGASTTTQRNPPAAQETRPSAAGGSVKLGKTERKVMAVLAEHGASTHGQIALLAGYSVKASTVGVALSHLRAAGYATDGFPVAATEPGLEWLGDYEPLPTGQALIDFWRNRFGTTEQRVLDALLELYPDAGSVPTVAEMTGYSPTASTVGVAASKLRKVGVLDGWRISDDFAEKAGLA
jgi:hypothetical protein